MRPSQGFPLATDERSTDQLRRIQSVTDAALAHLSLGDLLEALLDRIRDALDSDTCAFLLLDEATNELVAGSTTTAFTPGETRGRASSSILAESWAHKNHALLFEAFARLRAERPGLELVLTGDGIPRAPPGVRTARRVGWTSSRRSTGGGRVVFPSRYEGFGLRCSRRWRAVARSRPRSGLAPEVCGEAARSSTRPRWTDGGRVAEGARGPELVEKGWRGGALHVGEIAPRCTTTSTASPPPEP